YTTLFRSDCIYIVEEQCSSCVLETFAFPSYREGLTRCAAHYHVADAVVFSPLLIRDLCNVMPFFFSFRVINRFIRLPCIFIYLTERDALVSIHLHPCAKTADSRK